jgi:biopolymer transport protein ExbD
MFWLIVAGCGEQAGARKEREVVEAISRAGNEALLPRSVFRSMRSIHVERETTIIVVDSRGRVHVNGVSNAGAFHQRLLHIADLPNREILLVADSRLEFRVLEEALNQLHAVGVRSVEMIVQHPKFNRGLPTHELDTCPWPLDGRPRRRNLEVLVPSNDMGAWDKGRETPSDALSNMTIESAEDSDQSITLRVDPGAPAGSVISAVCSAARNKLRLEAVASVVDK